MKTFAFRVACELNHARVTSASKDSAARLLAKVTGSDPDTVKKSFAGVANDNATGRVGVVHPLTLLIFEKCVKNRVVDRLREWKAYEAAHPNAFAVFNAAGQFLTLR